MTNSYKIKTNYFVVHDKPKSDSSVLLSLFKDSHLLFKIRIEKLGNLDQVTSDEESEIMRVMLEGLIAAKKQLVKTNEES